MNRSSYYIKLSWICFSVVYMGPLDKELNKYNKLEFQPIKAKVLVKTVPVKANNPNYKSLADIGAQSESRDCTNCKFDYSEYGTACCDSAWEELLITCAELENIYGWDCSGCDCPGDGSDICGDGNCTGDETYESCPQDCTAPGECDAGYVTDCVDDDCCPETWIGDGLCDGEDQAWGCNLICYDNDGGDCGPACPDGEVECWDGSCATSDDDCPLTCEEQGGTICWDGSCAIGEDCPDASCAELGGIESWIADGYCDNSNNNATCQWDGGDCCGSTCLTSNFDCVGSGEGSYGACYNECLDPNGNDDCCIDDTCPFTCEGNGLITCDDGSCAEEECQCAVLSCECQGLVTCPTTGQCFNSEDECNTCENPDEAVEGTNYSDGYDQYYSFTVTEGGFLTLSTAGTDPDGDGIGDDDEDGVLDGTDTKLYLYPADCEVATTFDDFDSPYIAYNDDWSSSQYGVCPDCTYWGESYIYVGVPTGDYIIVSSDTYNSAHNPFEWTLAFEVGIEGCTNETANNYDPEANIDDGSCQFDDGVYFITCDGGSWQTEVSWDLTNDETSNIVLSGGAPFEGGAALEPGIYYIHALDSFGDGWNGNILTIIDSESNEILSYTLETGSEGFSETFVVEAGECGGDLNDDNILNIQDILVMIYAINSGDTSDVLECGDMNGDYIINVLDVVIIINLILE